MGKWKKLLVGLLGALFLAGTAKAGVLSVKIPTQSGIEAQFGMIQEFSINFANEYDFYKDARYVVDPQNSSRTIEWETFAADPGGTNRGDYWNHWVYFPISFVKKDQWKAYMLFSYKHGSLAGTEYNEDQAGVDNDRWRVERAYFEFKLPLSCDVNSYIGVGHDVWALDVATGGLIYYDDDPGIRWYGNYKKFAWDFKWARKAERTDTVSLGFDSNRDVWLLKLSYDVAKEFKPSLYLAWDRNSRDSTSEFDVYHVGFGALGTVGPVDYQFEVAYQGGNAEPGYDVSAWAALINFQVDLARWVPALNKFVVGLGGLYASGDDNTTDKDLEGYTGVVTATRFFKPWDLGGLPVHGANQQKTIGTTIYSWLPVNLGVGPKIAGVVGEPNAFGANPGLLAGVLSVDWTVTPKLNLKALVKYLRWDETAPVAAYYAGLGFGSLSNGEICVDSVCKKIDEEIGWETDLLLTYKLYDEVTLFAGASILFPGNGIDDVNWVRFGKSDSDPAYHIQAGVRFLF